MAVYSYYYGAVPSQGIGVQAQSRELQNLPCQPTLNELASMHALSSAEQSSDRLCFLLAADEYTILGMSYTAPPRDTGYNRSAPCSMQYIIPTDEFKTDYLGHIVNRVDFRKPSSATPALMNDFPLSESGASFHYSPAVFTPLVDALVKAALNDKLLLIVLPDETKSYYDSARWTIAMAIDRLPICLRSHIHFLTGLPVSEGVTDPRKGLENAFHYGANVLFCSSSHFRQLQSYYGGEYLDMNHLDMNTSASAGAFAKLIANTNVNEISAFLDAVEHEREVEKALARGRLTYEGLNKAAEVVKVRATEVQQQPVLLFQAPLNSDNASYVQQRTPVLVRIGIVVCTLLIIAAIGLAVCLVYFDELPDFIPTIFSQTSATDAPTDIPADIDTFLPTGESAEQADTPADEPTDAPTDIPADIPDDANG